MPVTVPDQTPDPAANASLTIRVDVRQRVIHPIGELDLATTDQVTAALSQLQDGSPTVIHLDLSEVTFFGADAVNAIVRARNTQRERSSELVLDLIPPPVQRILDLCHIDTAA